MFASQAALVIANARRHREERRAKADLETLINTSPVGVADRSQDTPSRPSPLLFRRRSPVGARGESVIGGEAVGLAVCRGIVEAHGGRIWVENDGLGLGSRCIFTLPVAEAAARRRTGLTGIPSAGTGRAARAWGACWWWKTTPTRCGTYATP